MVFQLPSFKSPLVFSYGEVWTYCRTLAVQTTFLGNSAPGGQSNVPKPLVIKVFLESNSYIYIDVTEALWVNKMNSCQRKPLWPWYVRSWAWIDLLVRIFRSRGPTLHPLQNGWFSSGDTLKSAPVSQFKPSPNPFGKLSRSMDTLPASSVRPKWIVSIPLQSDQLNLVVIIEFTGRNALKFKDNCGNVDELSRFVLDSSLFCPYWSWIPLNWADRSCFIATCPIRRELLRKESFVCC